MNKVWRDFLGPELMAQLREIERRVGNDSREIVPNRCDWYRVFELMDPVDIKVLVLGQDPYPNNSATGAAFAVRKGDKIPPSLKNIYAEIGISSEEGALEGWLAQGVFLLNRSLTCAYSEPNSHKKYGWWDFTKKVVERIVAHNKNVVLLLWGGSAISILEVLDDEVATRSVCTSHPSPLGWKKNVKGFGPFYGSRCFEEVNGKLGALGVSQINWEKVL